MLEIKHWAKPPGSRFEPITTSLLQQTTNKQQTYIHTYILTTTYCQPSPSLKITNKKQNKPKNQKRKEIKEKRKAPLLLTRFFDAQSLSHIFFFFFIFFFFIIQYSAFSLCLSAFSLSLSLSLWPCVCVVLYTHICICIYIHTHTLRKEVAVIEKRFFIKSI